MADVLTLVLMVALLILKGFFSGSEIAMVSVDRIRLRHRAAQGNTGARIAVRLLQNPTRLLTTTLLGTNVASIALTTVGTVWMVDLFAQNGELIALALFTPLFLIFGEIVPKSVYQQKSNEITPVISYPLAWLSTVFAPVISLISMLARIAARLIGGRTDEDNAEREQFVATVQMAEKTGAIEAFSRGQVRRVLRFAQMTAGEAMWPISEARSLSRQSGIGALVAVRRETGQRLIPLYEKFPANITAVAILESWDLLADGIHDRSVESLLGPVRFVPQLQRVSEILEMLHDEPGCTAIVVDETGNTMGLITLNLLVRRTLGAETSPLTDHRTESPAREPDRTGDGTMILEGRTPISAVNESLGTSLTALNVSTIGGFALSRFGHLPQPGERFFEDGHVFEITQTSERSILKISAKPAADLQADAAKAPR